MRKNGRTAGTGREWRHAQQEPTAVKREENIGIHNKVRSNRRQQERENIFAASIDLQEEVHVPRFPKLDKANTKLSSRNGAT
jgi:hypothetical protein